MLYLANPCTPRVVEAMTDGLIGYLDTPAQGNRRPSGLTWAADNGCFGKGYPGDTAWLAWLESHAADAKTCLFAVAPDVVADAAATWQRSAPMLPKIRALGYPAALVAQDGIEHTAIDWSAFDVLFIGGSTEWKLGRAARLLVAEAKSRGKRVHMGRVNSERRYRYALAIGCDSADGTYLTYGPDQLLPDVLAWSRLVDQPSLGGVA